MCFSGESMGPKSAWMTRARLAGSTVYNHYFSHGMQLVGFRGVTTINV